MVEQRGNCCSEASDRYKDLVEERSQRLPAWAPALLRQIVDRRRLAEKLCELCYAGDVQAMRLLLSYTDGLPIARSEVQALQRTPSLPPGSRRLV